MMGKERPIIFSAPMVKKILKGTKTQTRRIVKFPNAMCPQDYDDAIKAMNQSEGKSVARRGPCDGYKYIWKCKYGQPGDILWVRETVELVNSTTDYFHDVLYCADGARVPVDSILGMNPVDLNKWLDGEPKRPSIHMPRWASRLTLEITDIRVERLQSISELDCESELGVAPHSLGNGSYQAFAALWDSVNGKKPGCDWKSNPWVWAVSFKRVEVV